MAGEGVVWGHTPPRLGLCPPGAPPRVALASRPAPNTSGRLAGLLWMGMGELEPHGTKWWRFSSLRLSAFGDDRLRGGHRGSAWCAADHRPDLPPSTTVGPPPPTPLNSPLTPSAPLACDTLGAVGWGDLNDARSVASAPATDRARSRGRREVARCPPTRAATLASRRARAASCVAGGSSASPVSMGGMDAPPPDGPPPALVEADSMPSGVVWGAGGVNEAAHWQAQRPGTLAACPTAGYPGKAAGSPPPAPPPRHAPRTLVLHAVLGVRVGHGAVGR